MSSATRKIPKKMRNEIAARLEEEGLDGNGRFDKPDQGYAVAVDILNEFGIEIDEVVSAWRFKERDKGTAQIYLAWTNFADLFSPESIHDTMLVLYWYKLRPRTYEVVAYLS